MPRSRIRPETRSTGLTRADFTVLEDGQPQSLSAFAEGDFPLSAALAIDRSFSMGAKQLPTALSAARTFLGELRPRDQSMVVAIGSEIEIRRRSRPTVKRSSARCRRSRRGARPACTTR